MDHLPRTSEGLWPLIALVLLSVIAVPAAAQTSDTGSQHYIVTLRPGAEPVEFLEQINAKRVQRIGRSAVGVQPSPRLLKASHVYRHALRGFAAELTGEQWAELDAERRADPAKQPEVLAIELDGPVVLHQVTGGFRPAEVTNQVVPTGIRRMGLDRFSLFPPAGVDQRVDVDIAFLDTGVAKDHPDLNVFRSVSFITNGTGSDWYGHGTHVAGILGALNNEIGVVGVAPGARLWSVQVFSASSAPWSDFIAGMDYVAAHSDEIEVVNASLGSNGSSENPFEAITQAVRGVVNRGVVMVASVGNRKREISGGDRTFGTGDDYYPAALREVMAVIAMEDLDGAPGPGDRIMLGSNRSAVARTNNFVISPGWAIDVAGPGVNILSTYLEGGYAYNDGTSFAAPHVAGLVALHIAVNGKPRNAQEVYALRQKIVDTGQPQSEWQSANTFDPDGHLEPLAVPSESWVPKARILGQRMTEQGFELQATTLTGWRHRYEYTQPPQSAGEGGVTLSWSPLVTSNGTGADVTVLDPGSLTNHARLYRVKSDLLP